MYEHSAGTEQFITALQLLSLWDLETNVSVFASDPLLLRWNWPLKSLQTE